ncbi:MAG TPA: hypothetical protein VMI33_09515 [Streptosporangiaceae bacterium]|nr:hypothetical protein [Streptosporangiaceae bacterium]
MGTRSGGARELTVQLGDADELFAARGPDLASGTPPRPPGIDEIHDQIHDQIDARQRPAALATVIVLPGTKVRPGLAGDIARAVERHCELGISRAQAELKSMRREGIRTLVIGLSLFILFISVAEVIVHTSLPDPVRNFLGADGLLVVVGWVGLWYPIETLLYTPRPYRQEIAVLRVMRQMRIEVRAAEGRLSPPGPRAATGTGRGT